MHITQLQMQLEVIEAIFGNVEIYETPIGLAYDIEDKQHFVKDFDIRKYIKDLKLAYTRVQDKMERIESKMETVKRLGYKID